MAKQSPDELEVSVVAARDLDTPMACSWCKRTGKVAALMARGFYMCFPCYRAIEGEER